MRKIKMLLFLIGVLSISLACNSEKEKVVEVLKENPPNVLILLADQWRAQASGRWRIHLDLACF